jgi:hypothetical protein
MNNNIAIVEDLNSNLEQLQSLSIRDLNCSMQINSQLVLNNFLFEISEYLNKKEKINLREVNKNIAKESASEFQINLNIKGKCDDSSLCSKESTSASFTPDYSKVFSQFKNVEKLSIENIRLDEKILDALELVLRRNSNKIKKIVINSVEYTQNENIARLFELLNLLECLTEISVSNGGNRDKFFLHLQVNKKELKFAERIKCLKIDHIQVSQIYYIISLFPNVEDLSIENCPLDEDLVNVHKVIQSHIKDNSLASLNLNFIGLSSNFAMEALKNIFKCQLMIKSLTLKGLWFTNISELTDDLSFLKNLTYLDLTSWKCITGKNAAINYFKLFSVLKNVKVLNLSECKIDDGDMENLFKNLPENSNLEELILVKNHLTSECIEHLIKYKKKISHVKILNFAFNQKFSFKGLNNILNFLSSDDEPLPIKILDFRNTGINLKSSSKNIIEFILNKPETFEILELYFSSFTILDYTNFIKSLHNKLIKDLNYSVNHIDFRIRIFLKLNRESNRQLFQSVKMQTEELYKKFNILIR